MADPMKIRATARDGVVEVKILMSHEMETGQRKDSSGNVVPAHFIQHVTATCNGKTVLSCPQARHLTSQQARRFMRSESVGSDMTRR